jgi:rRNA-processing protein FCF1
MKETVLLYPLAFIVLIITSTFLGIRFQKPLLIVEQTEEEVNKDIAVITSCVVFGIASLGYIVLADKEIFYQIFNFFKR